RIFAVTTTAALTVSLVACGSTTDGGTTEGSQPITLPVTTDFKKLNNLTESTSPELGILQNSMEGLVRYNAEGTVIEPAIAEDWTISDDQLTYTFNLRDAQWSDGTAVTANDFVFAWNTVAKPETAAGYASFMNYIEGGSGAGTADYTGSLAVTAVDDKTLEVTLAEPTPFFLSLLSFPTFFPVNEEFYTTVGAEKYGTSADTSLSNGPFTVTTWDKDQQLVLTKSETYWDAETVSLPSVTFRVIQDEATTVQLFESGELTRMGVSGDYYDRYKDNAGFDTAKDLSIWYLSVNQNNNNTNPILKNADFRKALSTAIDREVIANQVYKNGSFPANYVITAGVVADENGVDFRDQSFAGEFSVTADAAKAQEYLDAAYAATGEKSATVEISFVESPRNTRLMEVLQSQIQTALPTVTVELRKIPSASYFDQLAAGDFQIAWQGWGPDYADPSTMMVITESSDSHNYGKYSNPAADALFAEGMALNADGQMTERMEKFAEMENIVIGEDQAMIPLMQAGRAFVQKEGLEGIVYSAYGGNTGFFKWADYVPAN
ncbi:MAG: peptide ABC transporter substrate-binding protein, partial [Culicoidibacterales bacterium]